jgi:putative tributyrin esterase
MKQKQKALLPLVETVVYKSKLLDKKVYYSVIEPERSRDTAVKRGVLFLLHGLFGSHENWTANTTILEYAREQEFIIVYPDAGDGWYTDSNAIPKHNFESFILDEIIPDAEARFDCGGSRDKRAIAGISMGGYGAFKFAFRRPKLFCFAASMSGAFHAAEIHDDEARQEVAPSIKAVFGHDQDLRMQNSLQNLIVNFPEDRIGELPPFYFDCGTDDDFIRLNEDFSRLLIERAVPHEFVRHIGAHDWNYWNGNLEKIILLTAKYFANNNPKLV